MSPLTTAICSALLLVTISASPTLSQTDPYQWSSDFYGCGFDDAVLDLVEFNGDLIACGGFTHQSGVATNMVGRWTGTVWESMGTTPYFQANRLGVYDNELYILGLHQFAFSPRHLMRWNGSDWDLAFSFTQLGYAGIARAMIEYDSLLIIAGDVGAGFSGPRDLVTFDGANVGDIAGKPLLISGSDVIFDMVEFQGDLFVTGSFLMTVDSIPTGGLARWDGTTWSSVEGRSAPAQPLVEGLGGVYPYGQALAVYGGKLFIGGDFTSAGDLPVSNIVSWDPSTELWEDVGGGSPDVINALASYGGNVYAGGQLDSIGGIAVGNIGRWNGSAWSAVDTGTSGPVLTMLPYGTDLVVGGDFATAGTAHAANLAWWDGAAFSSNNAPCGLGLDATTWGFSEFQGDLIAVGQFEYAGDVHVGHVAAFDGSAWAAFGTGANGTIYNADTDATQLVVTGDFTEIGGVPADYVAVWNGSAWSALGDGAPNTGFDVCFHDGDIHVAGMAYYDGMGWSSYIRRWNGSTWTDLLTPVSNIETNRIASFDGKLFAGYDYYDGSTWSTIPCGFTEFDVSLMEIHGGNIYIGSGLSQNYCGTPYSFAAIFDGTSTSPLLPTSFGTPGSLTRAYSVLPFDGLQILAGQGNYEGGSLWYHDGVSSKWEIFGDDVNSSIYAARVYDDRLYVGGFFDAVGTVDVGGTPSSKIGCISNVVSGTDAPTPNSLTLSQNAPNPFNPTTSIAFVTTRANSPVTLAIYDVLGRNVRTLIDRTLPAGDHTATWDGRNNEGRAVASGVYFYRLHAGGETRVRKMVLSK